MLQLLLDEHISPEVARGLRRRHSALVVHSMVEWQGGEFLGKDDATCMLAAAELKLTLVTYDRRTIPLLLKSWMEQGRNHSGVIFIDEKTISPADIGGIVRALSSLYKHSGTLDWTDRIVFLSR